MKRTILLMSVCVIVAGLCATSFAQGPRPTFTSTKISACKQLVDPGQPVCFTTQTYAYPNWYTAVAVTSGQVCFFDEFSGPLGCAPVNRFGQAQICLPITADVDVSAFFFPEERKASGVSTNTPTALDCLAPSHSLEVAVFVTSDPPPAPQYFPGTHPGCLIPHIAPACPAPTW